MLKRYAVASVLAIGASGCTLFGSERTDPLPRPAPDQLRPSKYEPENAFELTGGVSSRSAFSTRNDSGLQVEVRDFIVPRSEGPVEIRQIANRAALIEVREGTGVAMRGESAVQLAPGVVFTVSEGTSLRVHATGEGLTFRAHLYRQE